MKLIDAMLTLQPDCGSVSKACATWAVGLLLCISPNAAGVSVVLLDTVVASRYKNRLVLFGG